MVPQALRMAESAFKKYKTRDPYVIIDARKILLKRFEKPKSLLGFFTVLNRKQIIGINEAADEVDSRSGAIHELGHSLNDYKAAATGSRFDDYKFFSMSYSPCEFNANLTGADLCIEDEFILDNIRYEQYVRVLAYINEHIDHYRTGRARMQFEEEQMLHFYDCSGDLPSYAHLAAELGVDVGVVRFKFKALGYKGYELPNLPETQSDFLKNWQRNRDY